MYPVTKHHDPSSLGGGFKTGVHTDKTTLQDGAIGSQFDASKDGLAGKVEKAVDGPRNPASNPKQVKVKTGTSPGTQR